MFTACFAYFVCALIKSRDKSQFCTFIAHGAVEFETSSQAAELYVTVCHSRKVTLTAAELRDKSTSAQRFHYYYYILKTIVKRGLRSQDMEYGTLEISKSDTLFNLWRILNSGEQI